MLRHFDNWDWRAVQELEQLCGTLPVLSRPAAQAFLGAANKATESDGEPVERKAGKVFESLMGFVSALDRKDFTVTWEVETGCVADGVLMFEAHDSVMGVLFCVLRVSEASYLTHGWSAESDRQSISSLRVAPVPADTSSDQKPEQEAEAWAIDIGAETTRQARELGVVESSEWAVARLTPRVQPAGRMVVKGTVTCHGCSTSIPFESECYWGLSGGGGRAACPACGNQLSDGQSTEEVDGAKTLFFYMRPWTSLAGQQNRPLEMVIASVGAEVSDESEVPAHAPDRKKPPITSEESSQEQARDKSAEAEAAGALSRAVFEGGEKSFLDVYADRSRGLFVQFSVVCANSEVLGRLPGNGLLSEGDALGHGAIGDLVQRGWSLDSDDFFFEKRWDLSDEEVTVEGIVREGLDALGGAFGVESAAPLDMELSLK